MFHHFQDYTCPYCASGFIEQLENEAEAPASGDDFSDADMSNLDDMSTIDDMSNLDDSDDMHQVSLYAFPLWLYKNCESPRNKLPYVFLKNLVIISRVLQQDCMTKSKGGWDKNGRNRLEFLKVYSIVEILLHTYQNA